MKAVILAAGYGKRMGGDTPKPLVELYGLPLVEHKIRKLDGYEIIVVYHDERIKDHIQKRFPRIKLVYNPYPEKENGYSLYCVKDLIEEGESFILLMADHYYDEGFYKDISSVNQTTVYVSAKCYQEDEATKVKVQGDKVTKIGKGIDDYDYFDTGFFVCSYETIVYAERAVSQREKVKLSDIMQLLADDGRLSYKVMDKFWIDIDTKEDLKKAEEFIKRSLIKPTDGIISRSLNRKISTRITPILLRYDFITPNRITVFVSLLGFLTSVLFYFKYYLLAGIMTQIVSIIDGCDGEVARIKNLSSRFGAAFDSVLDRYVDIFIISAIFLSVEKDILLSLSFILALTGSVLVSYVSHLSGLRPYLATRDIRLFLVMVFGILFSLSENMIYAFFAVIAVITHVSVIFTLLRLRS
ncbi:NTP transferase domain-containing protein [Persephonella sp.]